MESKRRVTLVALIIALCISLLFCGFSISYRNTKRLGFGQDEQLLTIAVHDQNLTVAFLGRPKTIHIPALSTARAVAGHCAPVIPAPIRLLWAGTERLAGN